MFSQAAEELEDELAKIKGHSAGVDGSLTVPITPPNGPCKTIEPLRTRSPSNNGSQVSAGSPVMETESTDVAEGEGSKDSEEFPSPDAETPDSHQEDEDVGAETETEAETTIEVETPVNDIETDGEDAADAHSDIINITIEIEADDPLPQSDEAEEQQEPSLVTANHNSRLSSSSNAFSEKALRLQLPRLRTDRLRPTTPNQGSKAEAGQQATMQTITRYRPGSADQKIVIELSKPNAEPCAEEKVIVEENVIVEEPVGDAKATSVGVEGGRMRDLESRSRPPLNETELAPVLFELDAGLPSAVAKSPMNFNCLMPTDLLEEVVLSILEQVDGMNELFNLARVNRNFYRVFKNHEMHLIKNTVFHMSPAAWELREMSPPWDPEFQGLKEPDAPVPEYTPASYLRYYEKDMFNLAMLKALILFRCGSFLRRETVGGLAGHDNDHAAHVDGALWRIWTFCRIFGCGKNRENDLNGQMDWLNGGRLANQQRGGPCLLMAEPFFSMNNVFFDPPPGFGRGNGQGLSRRQLYDMTEIWNCLNVLLQPLLGMVAEARQFGIYDDLDVAEGDIAKEEALLGELSLSYTDGKE